ncbi:MAG: hypothetical protein ACO1N0_10275 [Fluviicola sp.]
MKDKTRLNLKEVFTSGTFGPVHLGMTISEVTDLLGKSGAEEDFDVDEKYRIKVLYYDWYEFKFHSFYDESGEYKLAGMQNDSTKYLGAIEDGFDSQKVTLDPWFFKNEMTFEEVKRELDKEKLDYTIEQKHEVLFITFPNKSDIFFEKREHETEWLCWGWSLNPGF